MKTAVQVSYFLLRVVAGFLFIQTGGLILFGWFGGMPGGEKVPLMSQTGIGGVLEFFGGILIMLGLFTRPVAFILSGMMAVAYWQFHFPNGHWPVQNQGMPKPTTRQHSTLIFLCAFRSASRLCEKYFFARAIFHPKALS